MTTFKTPENIRGLFNTIADKYDLMNNLISLGLHKTVKENCLKNLDIKPHSRILDACTGTGDLAYFIKKNQPLANITGIDFSQNMLDIAQKRVAGVQFLQGDVTSLEYTENTFDFVTMGFGLRNINNPEKALAEIYRVLKPGGKFLHLDFGRKNLISKFFDVEVPLIVKLFYGNAIPYEYLIKSKKAFPEPDELITDFEKSKFIFDMRKDYVFGVISVQIMRK